MYKLFVVNNTIKSNKERQQKKQNRDIEREK